MGAGDVKKGRRVWLARPHVTRAWYDKHRQRVSLPSWIVDHFEPVNAEEEAD